MKYGARGNPDTGLGDVMPPAYASDLVAPDGDELADSAEPVELTLIYDTIPEPRQAKVWGIPVWLLLVGGTAWAIHRGLGEG